LIICAPSFDLMSTAILCYQQFSKTVNNEQSLCKNKAFNSAAPPGESVNNSLRHKLRKLQAYICIFSLYKNITSYKTGSTQRTALSSVKDWAVATGNIYRKFREIWTCHFWDIPADTQRDRQTNEHEDCYFTLLTGGGRRATGEVIRKSIKQMYILLRHFQLSLSALTLLAEQQALCPVKLLL